MTTDNNVYPSSVTYYPRGENLMGPNLSLKEVLQVVSTASTNLVGRDLVLNGFDVTFTFTEDSITFKISPGFAVLDEVLIQSSEETTITLDSFQGLEDGGKFVVDLKFETYIVQQEMTFDQLKIAANFVLPNGLTAYSWDPNKDRTILEIFNYVLDENGKLISLTISDNKDILIHDKVYYKNGYDFDNNMNLTKYIQSYLNNIDLPDITDELVLGILDREHVITEDELISKNYQNSTQVNSIIDLRNYTSLANVTNYLDINGYVTNDNLISRNFVTITNLNNILNDKNYQNEIQVNALIDTKLLAGNYITRTEHTTLTNNLINQYIINGQYTNINDLNNILDEREFLTPDNIRDVVTELVGPTVEEIFASDNYITVSMLDDRNYINEDLANELIDRYVSEKGYVNNTQVNQLIDGRNFLDENDVQNILNTGQYLTSADLSSYVTETQVNSIIDSKDFVTFNDLSDELVEGFGEMSATDDEVKAKFLSVW